MWIKLVKSINIQLICSSNPPPPRSKVTNLTNLSDGPKATTALNMLECKMQKGANLTIVCILYWLKQQKLRKAS